MSRFQDDLGVEAEKVAAEVLRLLGAGQSVGLSTGELVYVIASRIAAGNLSAMRLAELSLLSLQAVESAVEAGVVTGAAGKAETTRWTDTGRLEKGVTTILASDGQEAVVMRLERMARSEVLETGQRAYHDAMQTTEGVKGWKRDLEGGACQLCTWWAQDGRVWPKDHPLPKHKGCTCTQEAVVVDWIRDTAAGKAKKRRDRAIANSDRRSAEVRAMQARQMEAVSNV